MGAPQRRAGPADEGTVQTRGGSNGHMGSAEWSSRRESRVDQRLSLKHKYVLAQSDSLAPPQPALRWSARDAPGEDKRFKHLERLYDAQM